MPRFLCTADLHIGRESSGFAEDPSASALSAFERIVDLAISESVDAVLIAGDMFDGERAEFAARTRLVPALGRLASKGIPVVAVAGNHDHAALPTFHRNHPALIHLFPKELPTPLEVGGVRVIGCSFRGPQDQRILDRFGPIDPGAPVIGLLHADVDSTGTDRRYNPVASSELPDRGVDAWVLGHVHATRVWDGPRAFYPGSPQALDPGETGIHGVRLLTWERGRFEVSEVVPVSNVRYESPVVDVCEDESLDGAVERTLAGLRAGEERFDLRVRVRWHGDRAAAPVERTPVGDGHFYKVVEETVVRPIDLRAEAMQGDARGQAARLMLALDGAGEPAWHAAVERLVGSVEEQMRQHRNRILESYRSDERFRRVLVPAASEARDAVRRALESVLHADREVSA
ncbi:MAG: exonuclease SbcCD subunit D [Armatimonadota bacterium]